MSLALSLCQCVLRPRRGLGQTSPSLEAPRSQALETRQLFHQQNSKGKIVMIKVSKSVETFIPCVFFWVVFVLFVFVFLLLVWLFVLVCGLAR